MRKVVTFCIFFAVFVLFLNGCGSSKPQPPVIAVSVTPSAVSLDDGQTKVLTATVSNDAANAGVTWALSGSGTLSAQTSTSVTFSAPASGGAATATITATSVSDSSKKAAVTITMAAAPSIASTPSPSAATNGTAYSFAVPISGGSTPLTWSISAGALPTGLTLSGGAISGTPNANAGQSPFAFTVQVQDAAGMSATQAYSIAVNNPAAPVIATTAPPAGTNGSAYSAFTFAVASGGLAPFTWSETGTLPTGLTLSAAGVLSGSPTETGSFPIVVHVQDSSNPKQTASAGFTLQMNNPAPPTITTTSLPDGAISTPYSQNIQATGGLAPYAWSVSGGTLPTGLALGSSTTNAVTLSGTPTTTQSNVQFTVQVTDAASQTATQTYTMNVTAQPIIVTISNKVATVQAGGAAFTVNAVVQHDTQGVTWALTANGSDCQPGCGVLSNVTSTSVTYTPPATVPSAPANAPTLTATSATDNTKSDAMSFTITAVSASCTAQGSEAFLNGQYAFSLSGFNNQGMLVVAGSFTADGSGKITAGEADGNGTVGVQHGALTASASSYSVGSDGRGCAILATPFGTFTTRIAVAPPASGAATKGHIIEWETGTTAYIASGLLLKQTSSVFSSGLSGKFAFLTVGADGSGARFGSIGSLTANGGNFSSVTVDSNDAGTQSATQTGGTGSYSSIDSNGRVTGNTSFSGAQSSTFVLYVVDGSELLFVSADDPAQNPVSIGEVRQQSGSYTNASLNTATVLSMMGTPDATQSVADVGIITFNGSGSFTGTIYENRGGTDSTNAVSGTYSVGASGRVALAPTGETHPPIVYLTSANAGFILSGGNSVGAGTIDLQSGGPFSNASVSGHFAQGDLMLTSQNSEASLGSVVLDGLGNVSGTGDYVQTGSQQADQPFTATITANADGTFTSSGMTNPGIVVSPSKVVMIDHGNSPYPVVSIVEK